MAGVVLGLVFCGGLGKQKGTPVREPAYYAAGGQYLLPSCAGDSEDELVGYGGDHGRRGRSCASRTL